MLWAKFHHPASGKTETWLRFHGGSAGDWTRPDGSRVRSLQQAAALGWYRATPIELSDLAIDGNIAKSANCPTSKGSNPIQ